MTSEKSNTESQILDLEESVLEQKTGKRLTWIVWFFGIMALGQFIIDFKSMRNSDGQFQWNETIFLAPAFITLIGAYQMSQSKKSGWYLLVVLFVGASVAFLGTTYIEYDSLINPGLFKLEGSGLMSLVSMAMNGLFATLAVFLLTRRWIRKHFELTNRELLIALAIGLVFPMIIFYPLLT